MHSAPHKSVQYKVQSGGVQCVEYADSVWSMQCSVLSARYRVSSVQRAQGFAFGAKCAEQRVHGTDWYAGAQPCDAPRPLQLSDIRYCSEEL